MESRIQELAGQDVESKVQESVAGRRGEGLVITTALGVSRGLKTRPRLGLQKTIVSCFAVKAASSTRRVKGLTSFAALSVRWCIRSRNSPRINSHILFRPDGSWSL